MKHLRRTIPAFAAIAATLALSGTSRANQVQLEPVRDAAIYSESGALANGSGSFLFAGNNSLSNTRRALLAFDLAASIPAGSTITSVQLTLNASQANGGAFVHALHRVSASWSEGASDPSGAEGGGVTAAAGDVTWTERNVGAAQPWSSAGGDFALVASTSTSIDGIGAWTFPSGSVFVADAQAMLDAPASNFGWIVRGAETGGNTAKRFDSRSATTASARPRLVVDFVPPCVAPTTYCTAAPNSSSPTGASIGWSGSQSVAANAFTLSVAHVPPGTTGLFFFGPNATAVPFGDGVRCVGGTLRRTAVVTASAGGTASRTLDFTSDPGDDVTAGSTWRFQFWYRDLAAGGAGFNLSDALTVDFCP